MPIPQGFEIEQPTVPEGFEIEQQGGVPEGFTVEQPQGLPEGFSIETDEKKPIFEAKTAGQEFGLQAAANLVNTAGAGIPGHIGGALGFEIPKPQTPVGAVGAGAGNLVGFVAGPGKVGGKVTKKLFANVLLKNPTMFKTGILNAAKGAVSLGVASGLMTPEEGGFLQPIQRAKQFGSGAAMGLVFGGLKFIPSKPLETLANSAVFGVPSTLANEPIEQQIFNYGLGAYFGLKGPSLKDINAQQVALSEIIKKGPPPEITKKAFDRNKTIIGEIDKYFGSKGKAPVTNEQRIKNIVKKSNFSSKSFEINEKGEGFYPEKKSNPEFYSFLRKQLEDDVTRAITGHRRNVEHHLRRDSVRFILDTIKKRSDLKKFSDIELNSIQDVLLNPPEVNFADVPFQGQPLTGYDMVLRPNHATMNKAGMGNAYEKGLAQVAYTNASNKQELNANFLEILNNWKMSLPMTPEVSKDVFLAASKKMPHKQFIKKYGENGRKVLEQQKQIYDMGIDLENRHLAKFNETPIKKRDDYMPHIFEMLFDSKRIPEASKMQLLRSRGKQVEFKFKKRIGKEGYVEDAWRAYEVYFNNLSSSINDDFIRRLSNVRNYVETGTKKGREITPQATQWVRYADGLIASLKHKPGFIDEGLNQHLAPYNDFVKKVGLPQMEVKDFNQVSEFLTKMVYATNMPYRLKLPIRNMGQTLLNVGEVGFGNSTWGGRQQFGDPKVQEILHDIKLFRSRPGAVLPGQPTIGKIMGIGMKPWMWSDINWNLKNAIMSGYGSVTGKKYAKRGTALYKKAIQRAEEVAMKTQYVYLESNRSGLSRGLGASRSLGRLSSVFTTWPTNYMEFILSSARPENRKNLMQYLGLGTALIGITGMAGVKGIDYIGFNSPTNLLDIIMGKLPIFSIVDRPRVPLFNEIRALIEGDKDLKDILFYTFPKE